MSRSITERAREVSQIALDRGWDAPTWDNFLAKLMLIMTEVQEAEDALLADDDFMSELADVAIRSLDVVYTLDPGLSLDGVVADPQEDNVFLGARRRVVAAAEFYRRGQDYEALLMLWRAINAIDAWCSMGRGDLWDAVDKKIEINRTRPRLHGKKRSVG